MGLWQTIKDAADYNSDGKMSVGEALITLSTGGASAAVNAATNKGKNKGKNKARSAAKGGQTPSDDNDGGVVANMIGNRGRGRGMRNVSSQTNFGKGVSENLHKSQEYIKDLYEGMAEVAEEIGGVKDSILESVAATANGIGKLSSEFFGLKAQLAELGVIPPYEDHSHSGTWWTGKESFTIRGMLAPFSAVAMIRTSFAQAAEDGVSLTVGSLLQRPSTDVDFVAAPLTWHDKTGGEDVVIDEDADFGGVWIEITFTTSDAATVAIPCFFPPNNLPAGVTYTEATRTLVSAADLAYAQTPHRYPKHSIRLTGLALEPLKAFMRDKLGPVAGELTGLPVNRLLVNYFGADSSLFGPSGSSL